MKEFQTILDEYKRLKTEQKRLALAIVIHVEQSSYRREGARMLICEDGTWVGGISGGCLEGDTLKKAQYSIYQNKIVKVTYDTREDDSSQIGVGLGCNGLIDVLIIPFEVVDHNNPVEILKPLVDTRVPSVLLTDINTGEVTCYGELSSLKNPVVRDVFDTKKSKRVVSATSDIFIEYIPPRIRLIICGKNYDVIPLVQSAKHIGYRVEILENIQKLSKQLFNLADKVHSDSGPFPDVDAYTAVLLMSHDFKTDKRNLSKLKDKKVPYIGLLGPTKRKQKVIKELENEGLYISDENLFGPMGLDTGANIPEEIAISVLAEIRCVFSNREGGHLRNRPLPIHV